MNEPDEMKVPCQEPERSGLADGDAVLGAAGPLCSYCQGDHIAADCPTRTASAAPDPDAEGTR